MKSAQECIHTLPRSRLNCRLEHGQLLLHLPAQPWRMLKCLAANTVGVVAFVMFVAFAANGWLPPILMFGAMGTLFLMVVTLSAAGHRLTETFVRITPSHAVIKTLRYGRQTVREYPLDINSHARQWYHRRSPGSNSKPQPQGIEIGSSPYDAEAGSDPFDESRPRFGAGLSRGEMDWLEWRINCFLDVAADGDEPNIKALQQAVATTRLDDAPDEPMPRPPDTLVRIEQDLDSSRIVFPNTVETRTYAGVSSILFGLAVLGASLYVAAQWWSRPPPQVAQSYLLFSSLLLVCGLFAILGMVAVLNGITRLVGQRELTISPEAITYRASLFWLGLWWTVPTADVVSVWQPRRDSRVRRHSPSLAPAHGGVIRTASREVRIGAIIDVAQNRAHVEWLADEIARRIQSARGRR